MLKFFFDFFSDSVARFEPTADVFHSGKHKCPIHEIADFSLTNGGLSQRHDKL